MDDKAQVAKNGAVLLGCSVACDAFDGNRPLRIVTHAHSDHLGGLRKSLKCSEKVLMTSATRDLAEKLDCSLDLRGNPVETIEYGETLKFGDERITLLKADHILGAAQVLVEDAGGIRVAYSGDFRIDNTPVVQCDILVVEATYGSPSYRRKFNVDVRELFVSMVEKRLRGGSVYVFGYHGKLQEAMQLLRDADVSVPFVMPHRVHEVAQVCKRHGMRLGEMSLSTDADGRELLEGDLPCVAFYHMNARGFVGLRNARICLSGWEFSKASKQIGDREYLVALSDHSDFDGLIEYVRRSRAKKVITDNYRSQGAALAKEIRKRLGVSAFPMPRAPGQTTL